MATVSTALISVSDKTGIVAFAQALSLQGVKILSTGGTAQLLTQNGIAVTEVSDHTGFPEMLDGRVKTLHPKIHGGILGRRELTEHTETMAKFDIPPIDLVCVNLYPFTQTIAKEGCTLEEAIENIDIGGPAMVRSAAKNWAHVAIVTDHTDYSSIIKELEQTQTLSKATRFKLARKAFTHTAAYDGAISNYLGTLDENAPENTPVNPFPLNLSVQFNKVQDMRYGENPHQQAAFYQDSHLPLGSLVAAQQLQGKALSFNNIADADAAWEMVKSLPDTGCVIVKHANPCGAAVATDALTAYRLAYATDSTSAFGGIIAFNTELTTEAAQQILDNQFLEVLIAPSYTQQALELLSQKQNIRVLAAPLGNEYNALEYKRVNGGLLVQTPDIDKISQDQLQVVSQRTPTEAEWKDLLFAWKMVRFIKSNAIVLCKNGQTCGIGTGQMSRVDSAAIAVQKAAQAKLSLQDAVAASDAFFPFRDGVDTLASQGIRAIIHPGGALRDEEIIASANEHNIAMVFTGIRHFRH